jgi:hypothetical protein
VVLVCDSGFSSIVRTTHTAGRAYLKKRLRELDEEAYNVSHRLLKQFVDENTTFHFRPTDDIDVVKQRLGDVVAGWTLLLGLFPPRLKGDVDKRESATDEIYEHALNGKSFHYFCDAFPVQVYGRSPKTNRVGNRFPANQIQSMLASQNPSKDLVRIRELHLERAHLLTKILQLDPQRFQALAIGEIVQGILSMSDSGSRVTVSQLEFGSVNTKAVSVSEILAAANSPVALAEDTPGVAAALSALEIKWEDKTALIVMETVHGSHQLMSGRDPAAVKRFNVEINLFTAARDAGDYTASSFLTLLQSKLDEDHREALDNVHHMCRVLKSVCGVKDLSKYKALIHFGNSGCSVYAYVYMYAYICVVCMHMNM